MKPAGPWPFSSTIRTDGRPSAVAVASAIAFESLGSLARASAYQASNRATGSVVMAMLLLRRRRRVEQKPSSNVNGHPGEGLDLALAFRSEEHTSELQSLMRISYAVLCLTEKPLTLPQHTTEKHSQ